MSNYFFGEFIQRKRKEKKLSLRDVAAAAKMSPSQLSKLERGLVKDPTDITLNKLAYALNVDVDDLFMLAGRLSDDIKLEVLPKLGKPNSLVVGEDKTLYNIELTKSNDNNYNQSPGRVARPNIYASLDEYISFTESDLTEVERKEIVRETIAAYNILLQKLRTRKKFEDIEFCD
jgi:transcriptional regulator with XRE-family HTH domain